MKRLTCKIGQLVVIRFLDHCTNSFEPLECEVVGRVKAVSEHSITLVWWSIFNEDIETVKNNEELITILVSTIKRLKRLKG